MLLPTQAALLLSICDVAGVGHNPVVCWSTVSNQVSGGRVGIALVYKDCQFLGSKHSPQGQHQATSVPEQRKERHQGSRYRLS